MNALNKVKSLWNEPKSNILINWYQLNKSNVNAEDMLLEAFSIIQNFCIIRELGQDKNVMKARFLPTTKNISLFINKLRKTLFLICEDLTQVNVKKILEHVQKDMQKSFQYFMEDYLELYLLHWESINYFNRNNLAKLMKVFKLLQMDNYYCCMEILTNHSNNGNDNGNTVRYLENLRTDDNENQNNNEGAANVFDSTSYKIDPEKPGLCLIINQQVFYKEFDQQYGVSFFSAESAFAV